MDHAFHPCPDRVVGLPLLGGLFGSDTFEDGVLLVPSAVLQQIQDLLLRVVGQEPVTEPCQHSEAEAAVGQFEPQQVCAPGQAVMAVGPYGAVPYATGCRG